MVTIRTHQYSLIVYFFVGQTGLPVHNFQQLSTVSETLDCPNLPRVLKTHSVSYAVRESHELDVVLGALPVWVEG